MREICMYGGNTKYKLSTIVLPVTLGKLVVAEVSP